MLSNCGGGGGSCGVGLIGRCNKLLHWKRPLEDGALSTDGEVLTEGLLSKDEVKEKHEGNLRTV